MLKLAMLALLLCAFSALVISLAIYRLYFHPFASIPGPRLAALTSLYEFYHDCLLEGQFVSNVTLLHDIYGPIVRIGPNEVHIKDPDFFDQIQNVSGRFDKDPWYYAFIGSSEAGFGTADASLHRSRRQAMSRFFSAAAIARLEASSKEKVLKLCEKLEILRDAGQVINLSNAYRCLAFDTVSAYCLPRGFNMMDHTDLTDVYDKQARSIAFTAIWNRHLRFIFPVLMSMSKWYLMIFPRPPQSEMSGFKAIDYFDDFAKQAAAVVDNEKRSDKSVLDGIVNSSAISENDKTVDRIAQEARTLVGAGTETTGANLERITYNVLSSPNILIKLKAELAEAVDIGGGQDNLLQVSIVQKLPYLTAIINEGLRLSNSVSGRLSRISRRTAIHYQNHVLPPGTVMSVNIRDSHTSPLAFSEPLAFKPERWLVEGEQLKQQENYFVPFGRGARSCIGKDLALMSLYLMIANFFYRYEAELFETGPRDVEMVHDFFAPFPVKESKGIRVLIRKKPGSSVEQK